MGCDRFRELWLEIDQYHLNYLEADESPRKIDELRKLEGIIFKKCIVEIFLNISLYIRN